MKKNITGWVIHKSFLILDTCLKLALLCIYKVACSLNYKRFDPTFSTNLKRGSHLIFCFTRISNWKGPSSQTWHKKIKFVSLSRDLVPKCQSPFIKLLGTKINSKIQNSVVMFSFSACDPKYLLWVNLIQKSKFLNLSWIC